MIVKHVRIGCVCFAWLISQFLGASPFPGLVKSEDELVDVSLHVATIVRSERLYFVDWEAPGDGIRGFVPKLNSMTLRTSGMSPAHRYQGSIWIRLYDTEADDLLHQKPFVEAKLPGDRGSYLMILDRGNQHGNRTVFFLNLSNIAADTDSLTIFNATTVKLDTEVQSRNREKLLSISSGLTQGISIGNSGTISFQFTFRGGSKQYVYSRKFSKSSSEHLILILVQPLITGSRDLLGHWVRVHPRDLISFEDSEDL